MSRKIIQQRMSNNTQKERLLREFISHLVAEISTPAAYGYGAGTISVPPDALDRISKTLGEYSEKIVKISTLPLRQKSAETLNYIEDVLEIIQNYTPSSAHIVPNLGEVDWSRAFFGDPSAAYGLGKIYKWIPLTESYGVAQLSNKQIIYESAISFGAKSIAPTGNQPLSPIGKDVYYQLISKNEIPNESYAKEKLAKILSIKNQNDFNDQKVFNRQQYYFVVITKDNKNLHTISTSIRQKDFIYSPSGLPAFNPDTNQLLTTDTSIETSGSTDIFSLPNFTKFCVETLRVFEVSPESWLAKEIMKMPPAMKTTYLKWVKGILVASAIISTIFSGGVIGAISTGLFFSASFVEASISFAQGDYGLGVLSLSAAVLSAYSFASSVASIVAKSEELSTIYYVTTGNYAKNVPKGGYKLSDVYQLMKELSTYSTEIRAVNNQFFLTTWKGSSLKTTISITENWFKFLNGLGSNYARDFVFWYEGTGRWILNVGLRAGAVGLDATFGDAIVKEFEEKVKLHDEKLKSKIEEQKAYVLEPIKRDEVKSLTSDTSYQQLMTTKFSSKINPNGTIATKPITLVNSSTGDFVEGIIPANLAGISFNYTWDPQTRTPKTKILSDSDVKEIQLIIADNETYSSLSQLINKTQYSVLHSQMLVYSSLNPKPPYQNLVVSLKN